MIDLVAGPWIGEFGWELCAWQGVIRAMAPQYKKIIIYGRPGHQYLYEDFANEYVEFTPQGTDPNMWMNDGTKFEFVIQHKRALWIKPQQFSFMPNAPEQVYSRYGINAERTAIAYHARSLEKYGSGYMNWDSKNWKDLIDRYSNKDVICIGAKEGASYAGGEDLRGASLEATCNALSRCSVLVGPSSGAMHLGSLCNTPHVVWSGHIKNKVRYETYWNPFNTPVTAICPEHSPWDAQIIWQPKTREIADEMEKLLCAA